MNPNWTLKLPVFAALAMTASCANPHFFPKCRPLFPGLNEQAMSPAERTTLSRAKADFMRVKHGHPPLHARLTETAPWSPTKVYQGDGYTLTAVDHGTTMPNRAGPDIVISPSITGGKPYRYDEVEWTSD